MNFFVLGLNHKTTPITVRERLYLDESRQDFLLSEMKSSPHILEAVVLSTCNRTEIYAHISTGFDLKKFLCPLLGEISGLDKSLFVSCFYEYSNRLALRHLLRVATSLDSLVLGEHEILGQLKSAQKRSMKRQMLGSLFHFIFCVAVRAGKQTHSQTEIGFGGTSISWAAVKFLQDQQDISRDVSVSVVGLGDVGCVVLRQLVRHGFSQLTLLNRTYDKALDYSSRYGVLSRPLYDLKQALVESTVCIFSIGVMDSHLISLELLCSVMEEREGKDLILIDLSVPRVIHSRCSKMKGVSLYCVDDLKPVVEAMELRRQSAVRDVEKIVLEKELYCLKKIVSRHRLNNLWGYSFEKLESICRVI